MAKKMIVTVIKKGYAKKLIQITRDLDIHETVFFKGSGTVNPAYFESLMNLTYDPERDIFVSLVDLDKVEAYKHAFTEAGELKKKNTGILLVFESFDFTRLTPLKEGKNA